MSDAIRCEACRWWRRHYEGIGCCELSPSVFVGGDPLSLLGWHQPRMAADDGCSRGKPKTEASNLTVSDGNAVAMVDGLPVFRAKLTEDAT